ncbi:hypothetical protein [Enterobacter hormaechei]|uniref:hypothetical protein n=1 Tax=Enterobacter hormaechei TaxID=158836 RepID=UPI00388F15D5
MAESGYGLAGLGMGKVKSINQYRLTPGFTAVLLLYHMKQQSAAFHAADAAYLATISELLTMCIYVVMTKIGQVKNLQAMQ